MNKAMVMIGVIIMAIFGIIAINLITSQQVGQELDYYLLKDTTEAAMEDAMTYDLYGDTGINRMDKERFMESFIRRFADSVDPTRTYDIEFIDLNEAPPKVSVRIKSNSNFINSKEQTKIVTSVDMIVESNYEDDVFTTNLLDENNKTSTKEYTNKLKEN